MKASEVALLAFLSGKKQFSIPIYQRTYSWTLEQCAQLWNDVVQAGSDPAIKGHFIGSIVYIQDGLFQAGGTPQLLVIDGQQRLTTLTLLITALRNALAKESTDAEPSREQIDEEYLFNKFGKNDLRYKLLLTQSDRDTLIWLIEGREPPTPASQRILDNYKFFADQIGGKTAPSLTALYQGMGKLMVVDISLDRQYDNPQLIFESLNSTGLALSQADLIRNYVLMGLAPQQQADLYKHYWYPMEVSFGHTEYATQFNRFMRDYLTVQSQSGAIPNINDVYAQFKIVVRGKHAGHNIESVVKDVYRYSRYFVNLAFGREVDPEIKQAIADINTLRVDVAYPFLLEVYQDYVDKLLSRTDFIAILRLVESYVFRRAICGIPTNSLNKTFAALARQIDKTKYLESFQAELLLQDSYRRFPSNDEFYFAFILKDVYHFRSRNYLLDKLENYNHKEWVNVEEYTIEHIMPQNENLSAAWQQELGPDWEKVHRLYLHTIGNLTLTGYNPEMSDHPFQQKRDMEHGFRDSKLQLNHALADLEHWNQAEIERRAERLAGQALEIWAAPTLPVTAVERQRRRRTVGGAAEATVEDCLAGSPSEKAILFQELRKRLLNLDASVKELAFKENKWPEYHIGYQSNSTFVDVVLQKDQIRLVLNIPLNELNDPKDMGKDVSGLGYWGGGDVKVGLTRADQLDYVVELIRQAFQYQEAQDVTAVVY